MFKLTWRNLLARKVRLIMSTLAIVLGIGFLAGVLTFSSGLKSTFDGIMKGSTPDGVVRPENTDSFSGSGAGTTATISPADVKKFAALPEVEAADGQVEGRGLYVLGRDEKLVGGGGAPTIAFNHTDTLNILGEPSLTLEQGAWPEGKEEVALDSNAAEKAGYEVGDDVTLIPPSIADGKDPSGVTGLEDLTITRKLTGIVGFNGGGTAGATLVVFSTPGAQEIFMGGQDAFTSVALTAAAGVTQTELSDAAKEVAPQGFTAVTGDAVVKESQKAMSGFLGFMTTFLVTFAVIAIVVGGFIIANTFNILVAQRVRELALVRALGASRKQVTRSVLTEALLMSVIGSTIGLVLGLGLARGLAALFRSFGLEISSSVLNLTPTTILAAYAVGLIVTMVSAWLPARRAGKVAPVAAMSADASLAEGSLRRRTIIGVIIIGIGGILAAVGLRGGPGPDALWIGIAALLWILTIAVISSAVGHPVLALCRVLFGRIFGTTGRLAGDNAMRNPRRTGATASALMIGLALVSAVGVLAASMSKSIENVVDEQFASDYVVQSANFGPIPVELGNRIATVKGVDYISRQQWAPAQVKGKPEFLAGTDANLTKVYDISMEQGTSTMSGSQAIVSDKAAKDYDLTLGSRLKLGFSGAKPQTVEIVGIYKPTQVLSNITVPLSVLKDAGYKRIDSVISINADGSVPLDVLGDSLDNVVKGLPIVSVMDKTEYADAVKAQVNQLLFMIYGLLALAVVIAVIGIINTLGLSVIERTREIGLLRAVGLSRAKLRRMVTLESVTIAVMGAVLGLVVGVLIGVLLRQSLSKDLTALAIPTVSLAVFFVIAVVFGVLAAIVPAVRASKMKVLDAIATE